MMSIQPGAMLGILGGGQLGRMFTTAAQRMGYHVTVLDPSNDSPAGRVADNFICANYSDRKALHELGSTCAGITIEFENILSDSLTFLANYCVVSPDANSVAIAQNRITEKEFLIANGLSVAPYMVIQQEDDLVLQKYTKFFPGILKVSRFGYDGKGQVTIDNHAELSSAFISLNREACVLEQLLPLQYEMSVIVARGFDDKLSIFPAIENQHADGILDFSMVPPRVSTQIIQQAREIAVCVAERLNYRGVLCVEFFVLTDGQLIINEIAPRPHNSGHYTIDACITSQFEQQVRTLCGLPLGSTEVQCAAVMVNLLGDLWQQVSPNWTQLFKHPSAKLHLYGKHEARPGRKMGHFTVLDNSVESALHQALEIKKLISMKVPP